MHFIIKMILIYINHGSTYIHKIHHGLELKGTTFFLTYDIFCSTWLELQYLLIGVIEFMLVHEENKSPWIKVFPK